MPRLPAVKRFEADNGARIYRIPCELFPNLSGRVYLVLDAGPPTLVDTGIGHEASHEQVLAGLATVRSEFGESVRVADITRILITHAHIDHFGGLARLVRLTGASVGAHRFDRRWIAAYDERAALMNFRLRSFVERAGVEPARRAEVIEAFGYRPGRVESVAVDFPLDDGDQLDGLRVVHTPGHSPGHVCFVVGNVLLAGDHILARTLSQQWPESMAPYTGLGHYLDSLDKVARLTGLDRVLGGHEPPIDDLPKRIDEIRRTHARRNERVLEILGGSDSGATLARLADIMYTHQEGVHAMLALNDIAARVEYLDQRGLLAVANLDRIVAEEEAAYRYRPA